MTCNEENEIDNIAKAIISEMRRHFKNGDQFPDWFSAKDIRYGNVLAKAALSASSAHQEVLRLREENKCLVENMESMTQTHTALLIKLGVML